MDKKAHLSELNRFIDLHEQLYLQTLNILKDVDEDTYNSIPIDNDVMYLGKRVNKITIGGLLRHLILAENHWIISMKEAADGTVIEKPANASIIEDITDSKSLISRYKEVFAKGLEVIKTYTEEDINKTVSFSGRTYSVMSFLWVIFGHHSYHLGQADLIMRQNGIYPEEYMEWPNDSTKIG